MLNVASAIKVSKQNAQFKLSYFNVPELLSC